MKILLSVLIFLLISSPLLMAQSNTKFAHPLQIEPIAIYTKARVSAGYWDKSDSRGYEQNKNLSFEGEYNFYNNFSVSSSVGKNRYSITGSEPELTFERWNMGLKYGKVIDTGSSQWVFGAGLKLFDQKRNAELKERENPEYYLLRPNFGLGFKSGRFEVMSEFRFQTETNRYFKEGTLDEFRKYYQFGIAPSFGITPKSRIFVEFEYREPYDKIIDTYTRYFNVHPGFAYNSEKFGTYSLSIQLNALSRNENAMDRGIRFSYFYFFDSVSSNFESRTKETTAPTSTPKEAESNKEASSSNPKEVPTIKENSTEKTKTPE